MADLDAVVAWRRELHRHPELAFEEVWTRDFVAARLAEMGVDEITPLAGTGLVARIAGRAGGRAVAGRAGGGAVALRADMDALPITEATGVAHASLTPGVMHACGHDGHTAMLLGAGRELAAARDFDGEVFLVFQPAEENGHGGGARMVAEGLMDRIGDAAIFGLHNWPGMELGRFGALPGPAMASMDTFDVRITGRGGHAAMPEQTRDPVVAGAALVGALQRIVSRSVAATEALVVSVTQVHAGDAYNLIPETLRLAGTVRTLSARVRDHAEARLRETVAGVAALHGVAAEVSYRRSYPVTVNAAAQAATAQAAARDAGLEVAEGLAPSMGSEDFAYMLEARRGAYGWLGAGPTEGGRQLHSPHYDFDDALIPPGVAWWRALVARELGAG